MLANDSMIGRALKMDPNTRHFSFSRGWCVPALLSFQAVLAVSSHVQGQASGNWWTPTVWGGASALVVDFSEGNDVTTGAAAQVGIRLPTVQVSLLAEYWNEVLDFTFGSAHLETSYTVVRGNHISSFLLLGLGYARSWYQGDYPERAIEWDGPSAAYGVGLETAIWRNLRIAVDGSLRTDDGGYNASIRIMAGYARQPVPPQAVLLDSRTGLFVSWLGTVSGPWKPVEPGYGIQHSRTVTERFDATIKFMVLHWQIPGAGFFRDYIWDTRAFVAMPGFQWQPSQLEWASLGGGPMVVMMGEGPENGATFGSFLEAGTILRPFGLAINAGIAWFWFPRQDNGDPRVTPDDQQDLMVVAGILF